MANRLTMAKISAIKTLHQSGYSNRKIAELLDVDRETVAKYVAELQNPPDHPTGGALPPGSENPPNAPPGSENPPDHAAGGAPPTGSGDPADHPAGGAPRPGSGDEADGIVPAIRPGPESECEPYREVIVAKLDQGLSATRIYQDLIADHGFKAKYHSVRRFVAKLLGTRPLPVRRLEVLPGEEAQIDFGTAAVVKTPDGKTRRPWVFRIVLSHSRKGYSEAVYQQSTEAFIGALENAFRYFGGVPKTLVIDNLKAAVKRGDWYDPEIHPKLQSFAKHYGTVFLPTKPYTPQHKGKVESGVKYVKNNALKGRTFQSLTEQNKFLRHWEQNVADTRIHGTTKRQIQKQFAEVEREALLPLPVERFPFFHEARRSVHRDGHVEVEKAYYSVPPEYVTRRVWVRWDSRLVRIFNDRWEQIAVHAKAEPGDFRTAGNHIPKEKVSAVERGADALLRQVANIGPHTRQWSEAMTQARGVEGVRVLVGLKALAAKHEAKDLEEACRKALAHGAYRLQTIRELIKRQTPTQQQFDFLEEHPVIRPLSDYSLASLTQFRKERSDERETG